MTLEEYVSDERRIAEVWDRIPEAVRDDLVAEALYDQPIDQDRGALNLAKYIACRAVLTLGYREEDERQRSPERTERTWYWVRVRDSDGEKSWWFPAMAELSAAGGWTNNDTWEDFDSDVIEWIPLNHPTGESDAKD